MAGGKATDRPGNPSAPILHALGAVSQWLEAAATPGAIIGGVAASILGRPRLTDDVDVLVLLKPEDWPAFLACGEEFGFVPRIEDVLEFAEESRVLLVLHQPSEMPVDIVLGALALEEEIVRGATKTEITGILIPLPTPESILVMKAIARRPRDIADIESILETCDHLDFDWIRTWLTEFDRALDRTDLLDGFESIVTRVRQQATFDGSIE